MFRYRVGDIIAVLVLGIISALLTVWALGAVADRLPDAAAGSSSIVLVVDADTTGTGEVCPTAAPGDPSHGGTNADAAADLNTGGDTGHGTGGGLSEPDRTGWRLSQDETLSDAGHAEHGTGHGTGDSVGEVGRSAPTGEP